MKFLTQSIIVFTILSLSCSGYQKDDPRLRLSYTNQKYSFSIEFPEKWINYNDFEKNELLDPQLIIPVIYFALPTRSKEWQSLNLPEGYAELFYVRIFTPSQWELYQEKFGHQIKPSNVLFKSKKLIYMINYPPSIPVDLYLFMKDCDPIIRTFKTQDKD